LGARPSTYAFVAASLPAVGARTLVILLFTIFNIPRIVVAPFTSSGVAGALVLMPMLPLASACNAPLPVPGVPAGGCAHVHTAMPAMPADMIVITSPRIMVILVLL
jgi:hypothetical protein